MISGSSSSRFEPLIMRKGAITPYYDIGIILMIFVAAGDDARASSVKPISSSSFLPFSGLLLQVVEGAGELFPWLLCGCWIGQLGVCVASAPKVSYPIWTSPLYILAICTVPQGTHQSDISVCVCAPNQGNRHTVASLFCNTVAAL